MTGPLSRRLVLGLLAAGVVPAASGCAQESRSPSDDTRTTPGDDTAAWRAWTARFVRSDGRVVDSGNKDVSHTEGQGFGMVLAEAADDRATFTALWEWTQANLQRDDGLFSWRWVPTGPERIPDRNNATDGELFIAWGLMRAAARWNVPAWAEAARAVRSAVAAKLLVERGGRMLLLPGVDGFRRDDDLVLNPSYYVFPALRAFAEAGDDADWKRVVADGQWLIAAARFGRHRLPPDWLLVPKEGKSRPADGWEPRFSYDAVRVPLYLVWGGPAEAAMLAPFVAFWTGSGTGRTPPAWVNLLDGTAADYAAPKGFIAVAQLASAAMAGQRPVRLPVPEPADDYYSATLTLLTRLAAREAPGLGG